MGEVGKHTKVVDDYLNEMGRAVLGSFLLALGLRKTKGGGSAVICPACKTLCCAINDQHVGDCPIAGLLASQQAKTPAKERVATCPQTICVKCKHEYHVNEDRDFWLCTAPRVAMPAGTEPITGRQGYGDEGHVLPWPCCKTINIGNCWHFEAKS